MPPLGGNTGAGICTKTFGNLKFVYNAGGHTSLCVISARDINFPNICSPRWPNWKDSTLRRQYGVYCCYAHYLFLYHRRIGPQTTVTIIPKYNMSLPFRSNSYIKITYPL
ncbi:MAG: hypothetical protein IPL35_05585 [Sphingobacteriales bacterium]|nr:hypothetical protein [Sphingobacteriales bacterium]